MGFLSANFRPCRFLFLKLVSLNKEVAFGLSGDHAPGLDAFPIPFFQNFWDLVEEDRQVFSMNFMLMEL